MERHSTVVQFWLSYIGFKDIIITDSGRKCIEAIKLTNWNEKSKNSNKVNQDIIIIILDMHLKDISSIQVAKQIVNRNPYQQIILTTTMPSDNIRQEIGSVGLNNYNVLTKPF